MGVIRFLGQHKGAVALVVVLLALKAVCDLALPVFTSQIVDVGIAQSGVEDVEVLEGYRAAGVDLLPIQMAYLARTGLAMLAVAAAAMVLDVAVSFVASRTGAAIGRDLRSRLFGRIVAFSDAEINRFSAASLITRGTNDVVLIQNVCAMMLRMVLYAPILAIGGVVMVMATNPQLGWIVVVAVAAVFAVIAVLFRLTLPRFKIMQKLIDRVNLVAREMLTGLSVVRAFNRDGYEEARFDDASRRLMRTQLFTNRAMAFMMPSMMLVMNLTSVAIVWFGAGAVGGGTLQTGDLIAFITYAVVIIMGCLMMGMISIMLPRADVAAQRIREVLACEIAVRDPKDAAAEGTASSDRQALGCGVPSRADSAANGTARWAAPPSEDLPEHVGAPHPDAGGTGGARIEFRHVSFRYEDDTADVLHDVSFTAEPGQVVAIVGSTGSGKSTVVKLVERFYDVCEGAVLVDGVDVRAWRQADLRANFGYVPQKAFLFSGTVRSNIAYGDEAAGEEAIRAALAAAEALSFVEERDEGLDAPISQGGANVSGGQRQRLAMARALVRRPRAYLFDDSFSALDYATDARVRAALASYAADATQIIVAQRISTVLFADRIVVLDEGRVAGVGTHGELMETCAAYREIALSQLSEEELAAGCASPAASAAVAGTDETAASGADGFAGEGGVR
ncbi:ABC transporter ATP-binding protein [Adlercreutzia caecimuris]|uniref:ABC transporter ATP-binding protein n=1 Tax=Adlercreutzia caecimuris TaxID=671266 RepID=UPI00137268AA|nr:ABC transporter ATP-binding protein [Adlercreutzia caecimuris]NBJ66837.1 ABC transporter ATP-binding protein [Adlercreutzia caecimuris]